MNRRTFLETSISAAAAVGTGTLAAAQIDAPAPAAPSSAPSTEPKRPAPLAGDAVFEFVRAGHGNLARVKEMLKDEPMLLNSTWDWGAGDWETALGGAAHVGNREIALHLLDAGARIDAFCAAMLGEREFVKSMLRFNPAAAVARGPHGYTLLYHVGHCGDAGLAEDVAASIASDRARHFNQALHSSVVRNHVELVAWLLDHGVDDPNTRNFAGKSPLDVAIAKQHDEIARLLRAAGAGAGASVNPPRNSRSPEAGNHRAPTAVAHAPSSSKPPVRLRSNPSRQSMALAGSPRLRANRSDLAW